MNNRKIIESLLFLQGAEGLSAKQLKDATGETVTDSRKQLKQFQKFFNNDEESGLEIKEYNDVFKIMTKPELKDIISTFVTIIRKQKLSAAAIETSGIIAYKQPVTKSQINNIRGVSSEAVVNTLLIKGLIEEVGIADTPGKPILYGITNKFYDYFDIKSLRELPELNEFNENEGSEYDLDLELYESQRENNN